MNVPLRPLGIRLARRHDAIESSDSVQAALRRLHAIGVVPNTIIDVGASDGSWSQRARVVFPDSSILAFEPLCERWQALEAWSAQDSKFHVSKAVAGDAAGEIVLDVSGDLDGSGVSDRPHNGRTVPVVTVDQEVERTRLPGTFLLKLDTHGYEVPILRGSRMTLDRTDAIIVEVYNFRLTDGSLLFHEMCEHMAESGFRCSDIIDVLRCPGDGLLWQADFVFLRRDHWAFQRTCYR